MRRDGVDYMRCLDCDAVLESEDLEQLPASTTRKKNLAANKLPDSRSRLAQPRPCAACSVVRPQCCANANSRAQSQHYQRNARQQRGHCTGPSPLAHHSAGNLQHRPQEFPITPRLRRTPRFAPLQADREIPGGRRAPCTSYKFGPSPASVCESLPANAILRWRAAKFRHAVSPPPASGRSGPPRPENTRRTRRSRLPRASR